VPDVAQQGSARSPGDIAMLALTLLSVLTLLPAPPQGDDFLEGRLYVKLRAGHVARFDEHAAVLSERAALPAPRRKDSVGIARIRSVFVQPGREAQLAAELAAQPWVEWVERPTAPYALIDFAPNDPVYGLEWALEQPSDIDMDVDLGWALRGTCEVDPDLVIGIVDTGTYVDTLLPDLAGLNVVKASEPINGLDDDGNGFVDDVSGYDFTDDDALLETDHPHGTEVASVIAARANNGVDMAGVASGAKLLHARAFDDGGFFPSSGPYAGKASVAASIVYLVDEGVDLINNSWTDPGGPTPMILDAIDYAIANDVHMLFGSANDDADDSTPANHPDVIAVGGIDESGAKSSFANYGSWVDVSSGASNIVAQHFDGTLLLVFGTSFSCPNAVGVAAHLLSEDDDLSISDLRAIMVAGGTDLDGFNPGYVGQMGSLVNMANSLALMAPFAEVTPSPLPVTGTFEPVLNAWGGTQAQDQVTFSLSKAGPAAQTAVVLGLSQVNVHAVGGILVPAPDLIKFFNTDAHGERALSFALPSDLGTGTQVWVQMLSQDAAAPAGWSFSNVVKVTGE